MEVSVKEFRQILQKDKIFTDYINTFLNLPIFARRLTYSKDSDAFKVKPSLDSNIDDDSVLTWVTNYRLPLFFKSELFYEYKLCRALNEVLQDSPDVLASAGDMYNFKKFLFRSEGEVLYLFWMDVEHLKSYQSHFYTRKLIIRISSAYLKDSSPFQLTNALREKLLSVQRSDEPQNRWNTKQQVKELLQCQELVLQSLREYWCKKYILKLKEAEGRGKEGKEGKEEEVSFSRSESRESQDGGFLASIAVKQHPSGVAKLVKKFTVEGGKEMGISTQFPLARHPLVAEGQGGNRLGTIPLPAVASQDSYASGDNTNAKKAAHIKISTSKMPLLFAGERDVLRGMASNDAIARAAMSTCMKPDTLISSSTCSLFSSSSSSLRFDLRQSKTDFNFESYLCAALRADFTIGNPFMHFLKAGRQNPEAVNYLLFWQSVENILTQDEMRRWYNHWCTSHSREREDGLVPYLSYFEPYVVAKNLQELCLFFLQPTSIHRVQLPQDMEEELRVLLPKGLGQGLLLAAQEYAVHNLAALWKEFLLNDYEKFIANCSAEKIPRRMSVASQHLESVVKLGGLAESIFTSCDLDPMWKALKYSESIKYAGIHQLHSRNLTNSSISKMVSNIPKAVTTPSKPPTSTPSKDPSATQSSKDSTPTPKDDRTSSLPRLPSLVTSDEEAEETDLEESSEEEEEEEEEEEKEEEEKEEERCHLVTTLQEKMQWNMKERKYSRKLCYTVEPAEFNLTINKKVVPPENMEEILESTQHLDYFRSFLASQSETAADAPLLQFWFLVEELKRNVHNQKKYDSIMNRIRKKFLEGNPFKIPDLPTPSNPDLYKLITAQANVRLSLEKNRLPRYLETLRKQQAKRREKWEEEKRERARKRREREREKAVSRKRFWHMFTHNVASFKKELMYPYSAILFHRYLQDEVMKAVKTDSKKTVTVLGKTVNTKKLTRDLGFWAEVERYKDLVSTVNTGQRKGTHTPEDYIMVYKKAHAIVNCYMDSSIHPQVQVNVSEGVVEQILKRLSQGDITYNLFHKASMEVFHTLFSLWRKFSSYRKCPRKPSKQAVPTTCSKRKWPWEKRRLSTLTVTAKDSPFIGREERDVSGPVLSFSLAYGLHWFYPGVHYPVPVPYFCEILPGHPSYPTLRQIMEAKTA